MLANKLCSLLVHEKVDKQCMYHVLLSTYICMLHLHVTNTISAQICYQKDDTEKRCTITDLANIISQVHQSRLLSAPTCAQTNEQHTRIAPEEMMHIYAIEACINGQ